jgi:magnesium and cobalt transporter
METLRYAADRDLIDVDVLNILFGAIAIADMHARDVMIPRSQLVCVKADATPRQFLPIVIESQHSRFPVIGDDLDDVRGILHAKDVLPLLLTDEWDDFDIKDCMRPAAVIPESKRLNVLLQDFRANRNHMAVVIDEYGHVSGAVTIEDVLEQIVGDIEDEHDEASIHTIVRQYDGSYLADGRANLEEVVTSIGPEFETGEAGEEVDTLGGYVVKRIGRVPVRGELIPGPGQFEFEVLDADPRRIKKLRIYLSKKIRQPAPSAAVTPDAATPPEPASKEPAGDSSSSGDGQR